MLAPGIRVVRGPDWSWNNQDGGEGHCGTVCEIGSAGSTHSPELTVVVCWDAGLRTNYRTGHQGRYDLRAVDNAQTGVIHPNIICDECKRNGLAGIRFRCATCPDYDLCVSCYGDDKHDIEHPFIRYQTPNSAGVNVGPRKNAVKIQLKGIFVGAKVVRGTNWEWGNQDGGEGQVGRVMDIRGWDNESIRSVAHVSWTSGSTNVYRLGHKGNVDLKYAQESSGGYYYRDHMPILGKPEQGHTLSTNRLKLNKAINNGISSNPNFLVGERVKVVMEHDALKQMQQGHGGWNPRMAQYIGKIGTVHRVTERGDIRVQYEGCSNRWTFHPAALIRVDGTAVNGINDGASTSTHQHQQQIQHHLPTGRVTFNIGDKVRVICDAQAVKNLQKGHGEWVDDLLQALGKTGVVTKVYSDGDLRIEIEKKTWTLNPQCVTSLSLPLTNSPQRISMMNPEHRNSMADLSHHRNEPVLTPLPVMASSTGFDKLVREASQGNMEYVKKYVEQHPDQVDARSGGKSCLQVAAHQGHLNLVKYLLDKGANVNQTDNDKDSTLHYAAFGNQPEIMEALLKAGAHINVINASKCSALHISAHKKSIHCVKILLKYGIDVNLQDSYGDTALHDAIGKDSAEVIELLCNTPAYDVTIQNERGFNALHHAALKGSLTATIHLLRRARQLADSRKADGFAAIHLAALNGHAAVARALVERGGADRDLRNARGQTALLLAVSQGHCNVIETLVSLRCSLVARDEDGDTALHLAIIKSVPDAPLPSQTDAPCIRSLCDHQRLVTLAEHKVGMAIACYLTREGCQLDVKNKKGKTPLDLVQNEECKKILTYYRSKRAPPAAPPMKQVPPLPLGRNPMNISGPSHSNTSTHSSNSLQPTNSTVNSLSQAMTGITLNSIAKHNENENEQIDIPSECMVCNEPLKSGPVFEPCGHKIACDDCATRMKKCLLCSVTRVFLIDPTIKQSVASAVVDDKTVKKQQQQQLPEPQPSVSDRMRYLEDKIQEIEEIHCCSICMERRRNVVFLCGHGACDKCAEPLKTCHMCREKIVTKINLF